MRTISAAFAEARQGLRARRRRSWLSGVGIALAASMLGAAVVVADGLGHGFDRAARAADLPDVIVRFDPQPMGRVVARLAALPNLAGYTTRLEATDVSVSTGGARERDDAAVEVVDPRSRRGYAIVDGRDLRPGGAAHEVLVERAFADAWHMRVGDALSVADLGSERIVGLTESPDNVGFPLAKPRLYVSRTALDARFGAEADPRVNIAMIWARDPHRVDELLVQARANSYGLHNIRFATRSGVRVLLDQAAGIVIDLLVALSAIALLTAGTMLFASARAEVQRRLGAIGVRRAVGATRGHIALISALEALLVAAPAASVGALAGVLSTYAANERLLTLLNEPPPGSALALPLAAAWLAAVALPAVGAGWPAWRAGSRDVVSLLRGAEVSSGQGRSPRLRVGGLAGLGARLAAARRVRLLATVVTLGISTAFVLLMLALASGLDALETDPGALGKRYELTASLPPSGVATVRRLPGVQAAAARYELEAADSFSLGESIDVVGFDGNHTSFEAPPLVGGRRMRGEHEVEVGAGLADALGLSQGSTLALALPSGNELRLRVSGIVSSLEHDGRVAYVPARALLAADPSAPSELAVRVRPGASESAVGDELSGIGALPAPTGGATARGAPLVATLRAIVTAVAVIDGLVCLYALIQACALTVQERRRTLSVLRACGAGPRAVRQLLLGAALALVVPAVILGLALERLLFAPALGRLAASYATLPLELGTLAWLGTLAGVGLAASIAVAWVSRQAARQSVVAGLAG